MTCGRNNPACRINLQVYDYTEDEMIFDANLNVDLENGDLPIAATAGHDYYFIVRALSAGNSYVGFVVQD